MRCQFSWLLANWRSSHSISGQFETQIPNLCKCLHQMMLFVPQVRSLEARLCKDFHLCRRRALSNRCDNSRPIRRVL
jgi:hypothetical protein